MGRYNLLQQMFNEIKSDYERIESGKLISVYGRKANGVP